MKRKAVVLLSGGMNSAIALFWAKKSYDEISAITFDCLPEHNLKLKAAKKLTKIAEIKDHIFIKLPKVHALVRMPVFLSMACNYALQNSIEHIVTGLNVENVNSIQAESFVEDINHNLSVRLAFKELSLTNPSIAVDQSSAIEYLIDSKNLLGFSSLAFTHTSIDGTYPPIDDVRTRQRAIIFSKANLPDPLILRAYSEGRVSLPKTPNYNSDYFNGQILDMIDNIKRNF